MIKFPLKKQIKKLIFNFRNLYVFFWIYIYIYLIFTLVHYRDLNLESSNISIFRVFINSAVYKFALTVIIKSKV